MLAGKSKSNFYTNGLRHTMETAAALLTPANTVRILSGMAALTGTLQTSADKEFYFDNSIGILISQMRTERSLKRIPIIEGLKTDEYRDYPIQQLISDLGNYYRAGTLASAIISLGKETAAKELAAQNKLQTAHLTIDQQIAALTAQKQIAAAKEAELKATKEASSN